MSGKVLILGGTGDAARLAAILDLDPRFAVTTSLAGRTEAPKKLPGKVRIGGFGGIEGLIETLHRDKTDILVDATHPFAAQIRRHAMAAATEANVPLLRLERPAWVRQRGDRWHEVDNLAEAAKQAPKLGRRAFLTVGRKELAAFADIAGVHFLVRLVDPPPAPLPLADFEVLLERGPFDETEELQLLRARRVDLVIAKNSGGEATYGKIAAARALKIPVLLQRRPPLPPGYAPAATVETPEAAMAWLDKVAKE
ncbi:MAG TPA: cobalt-precorrin-6A reductase [Hypericibacter adhaerens]|uniref:cobalt-precorrin-6A reductase n=1 Tax=Hypericibacter adhaerens TaxID=2602016 RepID=UPI002BEB759D|nr:cobalt-precorrin-6A reductase [Hypericibacter adhaerens]HWA43108.1 cobalt-precorrin-6A reductase [Hypericibacter adhaerens]